MIFLKGIRFFSSPFSYRGILFHLFCMALTLQGETEMHHDCIAVYFKAWNPPYLQIQAATEMLAVNRISMHDWTVSKTV